MERGVVGVGTGAGNSIFGMGWGGLEMNRVDGVYGGSLTGLGICMDGA
jgi:hypothetical protein